MSQADSVKVLVEFKGDSLDAFTTVKDYLKVHTNTEAVRQSIYAYASSIKAGAAPARTLSDERPAYHLGFRPGELVHISSTVRTRVLGIEHKAGIVAAVSADGYYSVCLAGTDECYNLSISDIEHATTEAAE